MGPVLITGCSSGVGRAAAILFRAAGYEATLMQSIPQAGADSPYQMLRKNLVRRMHGFLTPRGFGVMTAEHVAQVVFKAATVPRPRTRYNVGFIAKLGPFGRALTPDRVVDTLTRLAMSRAAD